MSEDFVENLKQPSQWFRVAFMVALAVILYVVGLILTVLTVAQILFSLLTGRDNENLRQLGKSLGAYVHQILEFLTYNSEDKPFPFAPYPASVQQAPSAQGSEADAAQMQEDAAKDMQDIQTVSKAPRAPRKPSSRRKQTSGDSDSALEP